jgi:hypothetical protein
MVLGEIFYIGGKMEKFYYYAKNGGIRVWERHDKYDEDRPLHEGEMPDGFVGTFTPDDIKKIEKKWANSGPVFWDSRTGKTYQSLFRLPLLGWHVCSPFKIAIPSS